MARETWSTSAPVRSQTALMEFILLIRCASMALATSFASSEDQTLISRMRVEGTQALYIPAKTRAAWCPDGVPDDPIKTRSGAVRLSMAEPSARNSGLERTSNGMPGRRLASYRTQQVSLHCRKFKLNKHLGRMYQLPDPLRSPTRHCAFLHNDSFRFRVGCYFAHGLVNGCHVCCSSGAFSEGFCWCVDC